MRSGLRTEEISLIRLGQMISDGSMALADFQRDFDWSEGDITSLLATLLMGWPAGSLLLVEGEPKHVEIRRFVEGPKLKRPLRYTVLDGQQRLTSLYFALHDRGPTVYAAQVSKLASANIDLIEQGLHSIPRGSWDEEFRDKPWQGVDGWVPLYALRSPEDFFAWRDGVIAAAPAQIQRELTLTLASLYADHLSIIHEYPLAAVLVSSDLEEGVVARIFERLNREGETLGSFDLVVARVYEPRWNLRTYWDDARLEAELLETFLGDNGLPVLQALALRRDRNVRQEAVLQMPKEVIHDQWEAAVAGMESAIEFLVEECGVLKRAWLPYPNQLVILAALAVDFELGSHREALRTWFFSRSFSLRFDAAANTRAVTEYELVGEALNSGNLIGVEPINRDLLLGATRRKQGALWKAFVCLLAAHNARDPLGRELKLDPWNDAVVPVSVAPKPEDDDTPEAERPHLRALTQILATRKTAGKIRRLGIDRTLEEVPHDGFHASQFFPDLPEPEAIGRDWEQFMRLRLRLLEQYLFEEFHQTVEKREILATFIG